MTAWTQLRLSTQPEGLAACKGPITDLTLAYSHTSPASPSLRAACEIAQFNAECGRWLDVLGGVPTEPRRCLVLGAGDSRLTTPCHWMALGGFLFDAMKALRLPSVRVPSAAVIGGEEPLEHLLLGALLHSFRLEQGRAHPSADFHPLDLLIDPNDNRPAWRAERVANAVNRARAWVEQPANLLTPAVFAAECRILETSGAQVRVLDTPELEALGAGGILAVGRGAEHGPKLIIAEWRGKSAEEPWDAVLVGKGLTYDGGGLNLKSPPVIEKMKFDMAGGAAVLGAVELAAARRSKSNIVALVPVVENAIDARAYRPGDVIRSLAGLTVEVINTDAEGRIVLADALTYGQRNYQPRFMVDVATLTGAVLAVLHEEFAGCYATDDALAAALRQAGESTGERVWPLPLDPSQDYLVDSEIADVANYGAPGYLGVAARSATAGAKFLQRFAGTTPWAHLDIAGTAMSNRRNRLTGKGATGFGVRLLDTWLRQLEQPPLSGAGHL